MNQPLYAPWVSGQITSPSGMDRTRSVAEALASKYQGQTPQNPWQGLDAVTAALVSRQLDDRADSYEAEQRAAFSDSFGGLFADGADPGIAELASMAGDPFAGPGQQSVINALLAQRMMPEPGPDFSFMNIDGELIRTDATGGGAESLGQFGADEAGYVDLTPDEVTAMGLDPSKAYQRGPDNKLYEIGDSGVNVSVTTGGASESSFSTEAGKLQAQRFNDLIEAGHSAQTMISDISALAELGSQIETGKGAEITSALGPWAEQFGVNIEGLGENQAFNAIVARITPTMRVAGSGATSDMEMRKFAESLPGLGKTPEGNAMIQNTLQALAEHKIAAAQIASEAIAGNITPREADEQIAALPDPLSLWKQNGRQLIEAAANQPRQISTPAEYDALPSGTTYIAPDGTTRRKP